MTSDIMAMGGFKETEDGGYERQEYPLYPDVEVTLVGQDGNAFNLLGIVSKALRRGGHADAVDAFMEEATSGDYDNLLATCMKYVDVS